MTQKQQGKIWERNLFEKYPPRLNKVIIGMLLAVRPFEEDFFLK